MHVQTQELAFDVPDDWQDRSTTSFQHDPTTTITLSHRALEPGLDLVVYSEALRIELSRRPEFRFISLFPRVFDGIRATELAVEYRHPVGLVRQTYILFVHEEVVWSLATSTPAAEHAEHGPTLRRALHSLHLKPDTRPSPTT